MAAAEAQRILQSVIDFRSSIHSERLLDTCPKTLSALVALENAINDEFEVVERPGKKRKFEVNLYEVRRLQKAVSYQKAERSKLASEVAASTGKK